MWPLWQYAAKVALTATVIVAISEIAKRSTLWGALLASLPLTSLLAFVWLYIDTGNTERVAALSTSIFWLVLPSLPLFLLLPWLLRHDWNFWPSLALSCAVTSVGYLAMVRMLGKFGINA